MMAAPNFYGLFSAPKPPPITAGLLAVAPAYPYALDSFQEPTWPGYARSTIAPLLLSSTGSPPLVFLRGAWFFACNAVQAPGPWGLWLETNPTGERLLIAVYQLVLAAPLAFDSSGRTFDLSIGLVGP